MSNEFATKCRDRICRVFLDLGLEPPAFEWREGDLKYLAGEFDREGRKYRIEIYDENVVMHEGKRYYECYMRGEFRSEEALIEGFAVRLTRLLSGGPWEGHDETAVGRVWAYAKRIFN